ncbi:nematocyst expressed protein 3-like [Monodelphis domestica]|uniref:nematocyst expressed protein 3-like n=1 Tax=Monodelphis domestica TaxID=13616 RepID=UPI0024E25F90|nr:nematocyst expressed protein 3-like [Monodelphis domestica]
MSLPRARLCPVPISAPCPSLPRARLCPVPVSAPCPSLPRARLCPVPVSAPCPSLPRARLCPVPVSAPCPSLPRARLCPVPASAPCPTCPFTSKGQRQAGFSQVAEASGPLQVPRECCPLSLQASLPLPATPSPALHRLSRQSRRHSTSLRTPRAAARHPRGGQQHSYCVQARHWPSL